MLERVAPTHILHCAWEVTHGTFWHDARNVDWVAATLDFARAAATHGVTRFVGIGTCAEYDWSDGGLAPRREEDPVAPREALRRRQGLHPAPARRPVRADPCTFAWARMFHLFGTGEHAARFVPSVAIALKEGREARCRHGQLTRDFIAVEDAGAALAAIVAAEARGPVNVASGLRLTLAELAGEIAGRMNGAHLLRIEQNPTKDPLGMTADLTRLHDEIGFVPAMDVRERLAKYVESLR